jgi:hypothetical protein
MANYTLTFSPDAKGWPSFYSYVPDWMIGMNNYFYSFNGGDLYRHNTNANRNTYYGTAYPSTITSIFNDTPTQNALWKTLELESDQAWEATLVTDIQNGYIDTDWFEKKEGAWFAFVRNPVGGSEPTLAVDPSQFVLRSVNGIGTIGTVTPGIAPSYTLTFTFSFGSIMSIGDTLYTVDPTTTPANAPVLLGVITGVGADTQSLTFDLDGGATAPLAGDYVFFAKNAQAESHGVLGHYCQFTLTNSSTSPTELFVVESQMMKSYP